MLWYKDQHDNYIGPWLGGYQIPGSTEPGGGWIWVTGEPMSYTNWVTNEPDNYNNNQDTIVYFDPYYWEDCASGCIKAWSTSGYWIDINRNAPIKGYIIEYEGKKPSSPGGKQG
jgi:hypothetical protein